MIHRKTIQNALVLDTVKKLHRHVTADEVFEEIVKDHPNIGRETVYRNLQKLSETGEIRKVEVTEGADCYDFIVQSHYHIRCTKCGKVFDVDMPYIKDLEDKVKDFHGFSEVSHDIMFKGICPACREKINNLKEVSI